MPILHSINAPKLVNKGVGVRCYYPAPHQVDYGVCEDGSKLILYKRGRIISFDGTTMAVESDGIIDFVPTADIRDIE